MNEYCKDLFELWELLEEMPAELEVPAGAVGWRVSALHFIKRL